MQAIQDPIIPRIRDLAHQHPGTVSLGQGMVFYGPPAQVLDRIRTFGMAPEDHRYTPVQGLPELLQSIEAKLQTDNRTQVGLHRRVLVTAGSNMGFLQVMMAITQPGDEILLPLPYYFNQEMAIRMVDAHPVPVPTNAHHQIDLDRLRAAITPRTRAIVTISPNNPTGAVYPEQVLREINQWCRNRGIYHISDEAYEGFLFDGATHFSPASIEGSEAHTITLYSLSKAYGMASWRIGYLVVPEPLFSALLKIQDTNLICPPAISQVAAIQALAQGPAPCNQHLQTLATMRSIFLEALGDLCRVPRPEGAFYLLLHVAQAPDSLTMAERLIREHHVAVVPGCAFGLQDGCALRVSYGLLTPATAREGAQRLATGIRAILRES